jgi:hypothetical protein
LELEVLAILRYFRLADSLTQYPSEHHERKRAGQRLTAGAAQKWPS